MKKEYTNEIPNPRKKPHNSVVAMLEEFAATDEKNMKIILEPGEYVSAYSATSTFAKAISRTGLRMKARTIDHVPYIIKLDSDKS